MRTSPSNAAMVRVRAANILLATIVMLGVNFTAELVPLNGRTTAQLSDAFHVFVTPAGYTFLIWLPLYAGLMAYSVYQLISSHRYATRLQQIQAPYLLSCAANASWLVLWHYEYFVASLLAMLVLLVSLTLIYRRLQSHPNAGTLERWCVYRVFSAYVAWISVAALIDLSVTLDFLQFPASGFPAGGVRTLSWAMLMIAIATGVASTVALRRRDPVFVLVFLWALAGIAVRSEQPEVIAALAWSGFAVVSALFAWPHAARHLHIAHA